MAADRQESSTDNDADPRLQIQEIIDDLNRKFTCCSKHMHISII